MSTSTKLTRAERRQIEAAIARAKRQDKKQKSAQDSIPFQRMFPDGICRVTDSYYTKTVQFQDINYPVFTFIEKKRSEGKCGKVAMVAGLNKFLRIYYGKVTALYHSLSAIE